MPNSARLATLIAAICSSTWPSAKLLIARTHLPDRDLHGASLR